MADATRSASTTTLDLDAIRKRIKVAEETEYLYHKTGVAEAFTDRKALIAEVERLQALQAAPTSAGQQPVAWMVEQQQRAPNDHLWLPRCVNLDREYCDKRAGDPYYAATATRVVPLFAECQMAGRFPDMERWNDAMKAARAAIRKARGLSNHAPQPEQPKYGPEVGP